MQRIVSFSMADAETFAPLLPGMAWRNLGFRSICLGYEVDGKVVGVASAASYDEYFEIDWIGVDAAFRRIGIGSALLGEMIETARSSGAEMIGVSLCVGGSQAVQGMDLLLQHGFVESARVPMMSFHLSAIAEGPLRPTERKAPKQVKYLKDISILQIRNYNHNQGGAGRSLATIEPEKLLPESCFILDKDAIAGCLCFGQAHDGIDISWLQGSGPKMVAALLIAGYNEVAKHYPPDTMMYLAAMEPRIEELVTNITSKKATYDGDILWMVRQV